MSMNMAEGWHVGRKDSASEWQGGPYSWTQLVAFGAEGRLRPEDLVWHQSMPEWAPAAQVPGLFPNETPTPAPVAAPAPEPVAPEPVAAVAPAPAPEPVAVPAPAPVATPPAPPRKGGKGWLVAIIGVLVLCLLAGIGGGAWWFFALRGDGGPTMGEAETKLPDESKLVATEYGEVPANQIIVMVSEQGSRKDAERLAKDLGGTVVGALEFSGMYQIEFPSSTAEELAAGIATAQGAENIEFAFENVQVKLRAEIWGVREDPYADQVYGGGAGDGYKAMGLGQAWNYIRGSGAKLDDVHVGVVDDGLYAPGEGAEGEFGGGVKVNYPDGEANGKLNGPRVSDGDVNPAGSHGTGVATIIGADPNNGGAAGVAGPLGNKLTISVTNSSSGNYGNATSTPDPADPTKVVWSDGKTYSFGNFVAITQQIKSGATVINCSWGADLCSNQMADAYKKFFEKMAVDHPDVLFVCAAGNTNKTALDNRTSFPCGHALPNMITVGAVDSDGEVAGYSTIAGGNYVVDLAAPGTDAVVGVGPDGKPVRQSGTSFASPEVAAAAAMLRSLNPKLTALQLKEILSATARTSIKTGDKEVATDASVGGKVLAIDLAVLKVINDLRTAKGLTPLTPELLEQMGVIDAVAITGAAGEYKVKGIVKAAGEDGADVTIEVFGENNSIGGKTTQSVSASGGEVTWSVTLPEDKGSIRVKRGDNGAASLINIEQFDINGAWSGSFTITDITITDQKAAEEEGCTAVILEAFKALKGKALPMTMQVTVDESGQGNAVTFINVAAANPTGESGTSSEPQNWGVSYASPSITFTPQDAEGITSLGATVSRDGETLVMKGAMTGGGAGWTMKAVFTQTKPYVPK